VYVTSGLTTEVARAFSQRKVRVRGLAAPTQLVLIDTR
jgi:hypothetical protein